MSYAWDITITKNTAESSPKTQILKLHSGIVTLGDLKFPAGCQGLAKVRLKHAESTIAPLNKDGWITGDDEVVKAIQYYDLTKKPYELKFVGINDDDTYDHTVTVRVIVLPKAVASMAPAVKFIARLAKRIFGG